MSKITFEQLDLLLFEWDQLISDDVSTFIQDWVDRLNGES